MNRGHRPSVDDPSFQELIHPKNRLLITLNAQTQIPAVGSSTPLCLAKKNQNQLVDEQEAAVWTAQTDPGARWSGRKP